MLFNSNEFEQTSAEPLEMPAFFTIPMNNEVVKFSNQEMNNILSLSDEHLSSDYNEMLELYQDGKFTENVNDVVYVKFHQTVFPREQYTYKAHNRGRTTFSFNWRYDLNNRQVLSSYNAWGRDTTTNNVPASSIWPLDVDPNWQNFVYPIKALGFAVGSGGGSSTAERKTSSFGILWNPYSQIAEDNHIATDDTYLAFNRLDSRLWPGRF